MFKLEDIGEKTINKIAEMALASQIEQAEKVSVQVKTDPEKLAKGLLESITICGEGVKLNPFLRVQEMKINLTKIMVHPFKALMGNIKLLEPSQGTISIVLDEKDIEQSLRTQSWSKTLHNQQSISLVVQQIWCNITEQDQIIVNTQLENKSTKERWVASVKVIPSISLLGEIVLEEIQPTESSSPVFIHEIILKELTKVLNFNSFAIDGLDLKIQQLTIQSGQLFLQGLAIMSKFPK
ncbi:DUF2993 domain-containing protein [Chroococcus sp. FPU101]|uniref:LmeA family phospholipid-binding protein n=1 Tax=Chroococcus sp. FPU101 TaxID=1974212 RepID=UPI001A8E5E9E|nr:DUF2993 domain-containing protein [Chroococcus sp. FPU101]GFE71975.1 hypothetical protein CFPU101_45850 [Chroococcus sp. FPU101]